MATKGGLRGDVWGLIPVGAVFSGERSIRDRIHRSYFYNIKYAGDLTYAEDRNQRLRQFKGLVKAKAKNTGFQL